MKDYKRKKSKDNNTNRFLIEDKIVEDKKDLKEKSWKCPKCGETVDANFELCWNCQNLNPELIENQNSEIEEEFLPIVEFRNFEAEPEFEAGNPQDYWRCPNCGEIVENDFELCWNCECVKPEKPENPTIDEIAEYQLSVDEEVELKGNINDFWKCPNCGETVENTFDLCWNCKTERPEIPDSPDFLDLVKNADKNPKNDFIIKGILLFLIGVYFVTRFDSDESGNIIAGTIMIIVSISMIISGYINKK
jgi:predicted RNA-binding Zn-ribbon protein involved in translation (DUF1610 family)